MDAAEVRSILGEPDTVGPSLSDEIVNIILAGYGLRPQPVSIAFGYKCSDIGSYAVEFDSGFVTDVPDP
jgi:hypothetical protein